MMWQKARIVRSDHDFARNEKRMLGREVWTECGGVQDRINPKHALNPKRYYPGTVRAIRTNLRGRTGGVISIPLTYLELLPLFAEDVPLMDLHEFYR